MMFIYKNVSIALAPSLNDFLLQSIGPIADIMKIAGPFAIEFDML